MKILENKTICIILMVVLIVGGFFVGGMKSLNGLYNDASRVFFLGEDKDGICVANDMSERVSSAKNMITIARKYEAAAGASYKAAVEAVSSDAAALGNVLGGVTDIAEAVAANAALDSSMTALYNEMAAAGLSKQDEDYRQNLYADFNSRNDTISHDPYNQYAEAYREALGGFPASLIASVMPVKEAVVAY